MYFACRPHRSSGRRRRPARNGLIGIDGFLQDLAALKVSTLRPLMMISSPVCGFRPYAGTLLIHSRSYRNPRSSLVAVLEARLDDLDIRFDDFDASFSKTRPFS